MKEEIEVCKVLTYTVVVEPMIRLNASSRRRRVLFSAGGRLLLSKA